MTPTPEQLAAFEEGLAIEARPVDCGRIELALSYVAVKFDEAAAADVEGWAIERLRDARRQP